MRHTELTYGADEFAGDVKGILAPDDHGPAVVEACCEACAAAGHTGSSGCASGACAAPSSGSYSPGPSAGLGAVDEVWFMPSEAGSFAAVGTGAQYTDAPVAEYAPDQSPAVYATVSAQREVIPDGLQSAPSFDLQMQEQLRESLAAARMPGPSGYVGASGTVVDAPAGNTSSFKEGNTGVDPGPDETGEGKGSGDRIGAEDARRWVNDGLGIISTTIQGRLAEGDRARQREYLERMAAQDYADNRNEREFRLKLAEIEARFRAVPSALPQIQTEMQRQSSNESGSSTMILGALAVAGAIGAFFALRK